MKPRIMYIEQKTGEARAFIGRVTFSKSGKTLYYRNLAFVPSGGRGIFGNHVGYERQAYDAWVNAKLGDVPTPPYEEFWISGPKKDGGDRWHGIGTTPVIHIDEDVREEYWLSIRERPEWVGHKTA
jgi:hypothetical protein